MRSPFFIRSLCLVIVGLVGLIGWMGWMSPAIAAPKTFDPLHQAVTEFEVQLGSSTNELKFFPDTLNFVAGKRYKLVLDNPSKKKHYFTAKDFADNIWSQKVEAGNVEVKGAIRELELKSGASAEWMFIPIKPGTYELHCAIPGHTEAGMIGKLVVAPVKLSE